MTDRRWSKLYLHFTSALLFLIGCRSYHDAEGQRFYIRKARRKKEDTPGRGGSLSCFLFFSFFDPFVDDKINSLCINAEVTDILAGEEEASFFD